MSLLSKSKQTIFSTYNLGGGSPVAVGKLVDMLESLMGRRAHRRYSSLTRLVIIENSRLRAFELCFFSFLYRYLKLGKDGDVKRTFANTSAARQDLGYTLFFLSLSLSLSRSLALAHTFVLLLAPSELQVLARLYRRVWSRPICTMV